MDEDLDEDLNLFYKVDRGLQAHKRVRDELLKKVQDRGSWYPVILDGYIED